MKLSRLLETKFPIIQGGMASIITEAFAAVVSNVGAPGLVAPGGMDAEALQAEIHAAKANTGRLSGVNPMLMSPHTDTLAEVAAEEGVQMTTTGADNPGKYVSAWKETGIKVFPVVAALILAKWLERYGIDGIIVEGCKSGGHIGELTTMALVSQMMGVVGVPVIVVDSIAGDRRPTAAFAFEACGVRVGTYLLTSEECLIHANYEQAALKVGADDTTVTGHSTEVLVRVLKDKTAQEYLRTERKDAPLEEMEQFTLGPLRKAMFDGGMDGGNFMAGQVAGMMHEVRPPRQIFEELTAGCTVIREGLSE